MSTSQSALTSRALQDWLRALAGPLDGGAVDAERLELVGLLEAVKAGCAARQARESVAFEESQREQQRAAGVPAAQVGRGVAEQVALARRESPTQGSRHLGLAKALVREMPRTLGALARGETSEWTATVVVRETACLAAEDRRAVDAELGDRLATLSVGRARREAWAAACRLDPHAAVARHARAVADRHVSVRPAPDAMTYLTALLPVKDGVTVHAALTAAAGTARASGDERSRGQVMADTLVDRLVGNASGQAVEVCLVMTDTALLAQGDEPALLTTTDASGSSPAADLVPAGVARDLVRDAARSFVRRLYTDPTTGQLVALESGRRLFEGLLRRMLVLRDQACRTPWCDAPVRHADHIRRHADGGPTSLVNAQGLCERCHQTKDLPGWSAHTVDGEPPGQRVVRTTTPTGMTYDSTAPPLLARPPEPPREARERLAG